MEMDPISNGEMTKESFGYLNLLLFFLIEEWPRLKYILFETDLSTSENLFRENESYKTIPNFYHKLPKNETLAQKVTRRSVNTIFTKTKQEAFE